MFLKISKKTNMFLKILGQTGGCMYADQITLFGRPYLGNLI